MAGRKKTTAKARWTRREYLEDALHQMETTAADAESSGSYQAAVAAKKSAMQIRSEIDQIDEADRVMALPPSVEEHQAEVIRQVRRLRAAAEASNSFGPAADLLKLESALVQAEADRQAALAAQQETRTAAEVLALVQAKMDALPDVLRLRLEGTLPPMAKPEADVA